MSEQQQPQIQATSEQIAKWKAEHPQGIYSYEVEDRVIYFCNPTRKHINAVLSKANADAPLDMFERLAKMTKLGGDDTILTNDELFKGLVETLRKKMDGKKGEVVNL
jgi:hypothetical protein